MPPFNNFENGIANIPEGELNRYQVKFASGTSNFSGDIVPILERTVGSNGILDDLDEEGYRSISNTIFTIGTVTRKTGILSDILPSLHIELILPEPFDRKSYIVLIMDNEQHSLVDWAVANPFPTSSYFPLTDSINATVYFEIPLVPITKERSLDGDDNLIENLIERVSQWNNGQRLQWTPPSRQ